MPRGGLFCLFKTTVCDIVPSTERCMRAEVIISFSCLLSNTGRKQNKSKERNCLYRACSLLLLPILVPRIRFQQANAICFVCDNKSPTTSFKFVPGANADRDPSGMP